MKSERKRNVINEMWKESDDWNHVEEEWFYDESEQIWKWIPGRLWLKRVISVAVPGYSIILPLRAGL